jgi:hypothetical protein
VVADGKTDVSELHVCLTTVPASEFRIVLLLVAVTLALDAIVVGRFVALSQCGDVVASHCLYNVAKNVWMMEIRVLRVTPLVE